MEKLEKEKINVSWNVLAGLLRKLVADGRLEGAGTMVRNDTQRGAIASVQVIAQARLDGSFQLLWKQVPDPTHDSRKWPFRCWTQAFATV